MKFEGHATSLRIHSSTQNRIREIIDSTNFSSAEELINYLLDRYLVEKNEDDTETKEAVKA